MSLVLHLPPELESDLVAEASRMPGATACVSRSAAVRVALLGVERAHHANRAYHNSKQCLRTD